MRLNVRTSIAMRVLASRPPGPGNQVGRLRRISVGLKYLKTNGRSVGFASSDLWARTRFYCLLKLVELCRFQVIDIEPFAR